MPTYYGKFGDRIKFGVDYTRRYGACDNLAERAPDSFQFSNEVICATREKGKIVRVDP